MALNISERIGRLDVPGILREKAIPFCRLKEGGIWEDPEAGHRVGVLDAGVADAVKRLFGGFRARLIIGDPPYNITVGKAISPDLFRIDLPKYLSFSKRWVQNALEVMEADSHLYVWMGADFRSGFQPLPDFMILMRGFPELEPKNLITVRNQRGYGTQKNWMWVRQELLYYQRGQPRFHPDAEYTDIPKILRGYYKTVKGKLTENLQRSRSPFIRAGNVWVDIQQVFYRLEENVPGCYAQKPLKAIERLIRSATVEGELVGDFFAHSGTTLIAGERLKRPVFSLDSDPVFAELTIRRLERYRVTGKTGWGRENPFPEIS